MGNELDLNEGETLVYLMKHDDNEHWLAEDGKGKVGYVPAHIVRVFSTKNNMSLCLPNIPKSAEFLKQPLHNKTAVHLRVIQILTIHVLHCQKTPIDEIRREIQERHPLASSRDLNAPIGCRNS